MSTCTSSAYRNDQLTHCTRDHGHSGVHLGRIVVDVDSDGPFASAEELVQWTDADEVNDTEPVDELPVWYSALPIGEHVRVTAVYGIDPIEGQLSGCVLDDHEQISAIVVLTQIDAAEGVRTLMPWANVAAIAQAVEL